MKCNQHPAALTREEEVIETANRAAKSLRYRLGGAVDAPITDTMIIAAAWFITYAGYTREFDDALIRALGLRWVPTAMGYPQLERHR